MKNLCRIQKIYSTLLFIFIIILTSCEQPVEQQVTNNGYIEPANLNQNPSFSPDGKFLVYNHIPARSSDTLYPYGLYIVEVETGEKKLLIQGDYRLPEWSPTDDRIIFTDRTLYSINSDGTGFKPLIGNQHGAESAWSKDGEKIGFWGWKDGGDSKDTSYTWIMNSDGSEMQILLKGPSIGDWSPNGKQIIYSGPNITTKKLDQLFVFNIDEKTTSPLLLNENESYGKPSWSVNNKIAFTIRTLRFSDIYTIDADGKNRIKIVEEGSMPSWSKDGKKLAYTNSNFDICVINENGSGNRIVLKNKMYN